MLIEDLQVVLKVAEFGNITAAANHLEMRSATASAAVKRVENALGVELFVRTTRHLRLSSAGERYLPQCEQALLLLEQAKLSVSHKQHTIEGDLRIALSSDLGRNHVAWWLDEIMERYPNLSLRAHISDRNVDFYRDSIDIALRYGSPNDSNLYGFKVCDVPRVVCASPEYVERCGAPEHPSQLGSHNGLLYQLYDGVHDVWDFYNAEQEFKVKMSSNRVSNDADLVRRWCVAGKGIASKSILDMSTDLLSGNVVALMPNYPHRATELWLVCPSRQSITPTVRLLRDTFRQKTQAILTDLVEKGVLSSQCLPMTTRSEGRAE